MTLPTAKNKTPSCHSLMFLLAMSSFSACLPSRMLVNSFRRLRLHSRSTHRTNGLSFTGFASRLLWPSFMTFCSQQPV